MDHSESDKRFYVYLHKDEVGDIRYIGSGSGRRFSSSTGRTSLHKELFGSLTKEIITPLLCKDEALKIEQELISAHWDSGKLLNVKKRTVKNYNILYKDFCDFMYCDESSPSGLRWKVTIKGTYIQAGEIAGSLAKGSRYYRVGFKGLSYLSHRVVFVLANKIDITNNLVIDHIDGCRLNNYSENLRLVTPQENCNNKDFVRNAKYSSISLQWDSSGRRFRIRKDEYSKGGADKKTTSRSFKPDKLFPNIEYEKAKSFSFALVTKYKELLLKGEIDFSVSAEDFKNRHFDTFSFT